MGTSKAIGLVELPHLTDAIEVLDTMQKTADVSFLTWEKKLGGRLVTLIVQGEVSSVKEAIEAAHRSGAGKIAAAAVIANPHVETMKMVYKSAEKLIKKEKKPLETGQEEKTEASFIVQESPVEATGTGKRTTEGKKTKSKKVKAENEKGGKEDGTASIGNGGNEGAGRID